MAKRRILKKDISGIAGELFSETLFCRLYIPGTDPDKADKVMARILDMQDEFIRRANHIDGKEDGKHVKAYFRKLWKDLQIEVNAVGIEIQELSK